MRTKMRGCGAIPIRKQPRVRTFAVGPVRWILESSESLEIRLHYARIFAGQNSPKRWACYYSSVYSAGVYSDVTEVSFLLQQYAIRHKIRCASKDPAPGGSPGKEIKGTILTNSKPLRPRTLPIFFICLPQQAPYSGHQANSISDLLWSYVDSERRDSSTVFPLLTNPVSRKSRIISLPAGHEHE